MPLHMLAYPETRHGIHDPEHRYTLGWRGLTLAHVVVHKRTKGVSSPEVHMPGESSPHALWGLKTGQGSYGDPPKWSARPPNYGGSALKNTPHLGSTKRGLFSRIPL